MLYSKPLARLVEEFQKLPGIGPKSAQRLAFHVLKKSEAEVEQFSTALKEAKSLLKTCTTCFNLSAQSPCELCANPNRDPSVICVIPEVKDLYALEKTGEYRGMYHVLQGLISPLDGIGPQDLRLAELINRLGESSPVKEIILALPPSVEGDTTSLYLSRLLKPLGITVSRIAFGLPVGGDLEYADALTLTRAMSGRSLVS